MSPLECIENFVKTNYHYAVTRLDRAPSGCGFLDIDAEEIRIVVEHQPERGYGLSIDYGQILYGEGPDEVYRYQDELKDRLRRLLEG